jgi:hypothetical protein
MLTMVDVSDPGLARPLLPALFKGVFVSLAVVAGFFTFTYLPQVAMLAFVSGPLGKRGYPASHILSVRRSCSTGAGRVLRGDIFLVKNLHFGSNRHRPLRSSKLLQNPMRCAR